MLPIFTDDRLQLVRGEVENPLVSRRVRQEVFVQTTLVVTSAAVGVSQKTIAAANI